MAEERQQSRSTQPQGQQHQPQVQQLSGQATPGDAAPAAMETTGVSRRGGGMPSVFNMDPFDMFRTSPFPLMRRFMEDIEQWAQLGIGPWWTEHGCDGQ